MISIIVVFPKLEDAKNIRNLLVRHGYEVTGVCSSGSQALQLAEHLSDGIVLCGYQFQDMLYSELYECLPVNMQMLLAASPRILEECQSRDIVFLELPLKVHDLVNTLEMMSGSILRQRKKRKAMPRQRSEGERKIIDKAKKLLMERNHLTEEEAHRYIQKCSMDSGNTLVETAQMVFSLMKF